MSLIVICGILVLSVIASVLHNRAAGIEPLNKDDFH